ncbi:hypothetical protein LIA77_05314 [Sarocladium implicatum]|nr:hypothetical protein LIA77_05314 [Sarocladium implicatum]
MCIRSPLLRSVYLDQWLNTHPLVEIQTPVRPRTKGRSATEPAKTSTKFWKVDGPEIPSTPKDIEKMVEKRALDILSQLTEQLKLNATEPKKRTVKDFSFAQRQTYDTESDVPLGFVDGSPTPVTKTGRITSKKNAVSEVNIETVSLGDESSSGSEHEFHDAVNKVEGCVADYEGPKLRCPQQQLGTSSTRRRQEKPQKNPSSPYLSPRDGQNATKQPLRTSPRLHGRAPEYEGGIPPLGLPKSVSGSERLLTSCPATAKAAKPRAMK